MIKCHNWLPKNVDVEGQIFFFFFFRLILRIRKTKRKPERKYVCEICAKPFKSLSNLHQHRLVHSNVREFCCDICKRRYKTKNHIKWVSFSRRFFLSNFHYIFWMIQFRRNHMKTHYGGSSIYSHLCSVCGNRYQNLTRLVEHMRHHTGERPYECDICHKGMMHSCNGIDA